MEGKNKRGRTDGEGSGPGMDRQEGHGLNGRIQTGEPKSGMRSGVAGAAQHHILSKKKRTVRSTAQTAKETVDGKRHPFTHTKVAEERAVHGTRPLEIRPRHPLGTDGPGRDTISGQTNRCSTPN